MYTPDVVQILQRQGVKFEQAKESFTVNTVFDYESNTSQRKTFPKGTILLSCNQPQHLLINSVMEKSLEIEDSVMYDMAIWALPIAYNLHAYFTKENVSVPSEALSETKANNSVLPNAYGYALDWNQRNAPAALAHIWKLGYKVRSASKPFKMDNISFSAGTLIILTGANIDKKVTLSADLQIVSLKHNVSIHSISTGRARHGEIITIVALFMMIYMYLRHPFLIFCRQISCFRMNTPRPISVNIKPIMIRTTIWCRLIML